MFWQHGQPSRSINFLSAHDGFTLRDVVRYRVKDNFNNGEENRDGKSGEATWTGGNVKALLAMNGARVLAVQQRYLKK